MRIDHVEMALVDRHIGRFADRAARMVQPFRHVAELHELLEIGKGRIASPAFEITDEGRTINWRQHKAFPADLDRSLGVARMLRIAGRCALAKCARATPLDLHARSPHGRASFAPALQRRRVLDKTDTDLFTNGLGIVFDDGEGFLVQSLEIRDPALDETGGFQPWRGAFGASCSTAATTSTPSGRLYTLGLGHNHIPHWPDPLTLCPIEKPGKPSHVSVRTEGETDMVTGVPRGPIDKPAFPQRARPMMSSEHEICLIVDFGSPLAQMVARRLRESHIYCEIHPFDRVDGKLLQHIRPRAIILSDGPAAIEAAGSPRADEAVFTAGLPVLGIGYGQMLMVDQLGGEVAKAAAASAPGLARLSQVGPSELLRDVATSSGSMEVWADRAGGDMQLPAGFTVQATAPGLPHALIDR